MPTRIAEVVAEVTDARVGQGEILGGIHILSVKSKACWISPRKTLVSGSPGRLGERNKSTDVGLGAAITTPTQ